MKTRKLTLCAFAAIAALVSACSNDELAGNETPQEGIVIKATAGTPQGSADTRLTHTDGTSKMNIVWAANDKFTVYGGSEKHDYTIEGNGGNSSANFDNATDSWTTVPTGDIYALYPANITTDPTAITLSLEGQNGTLAGLTAYNYMTASTTYSGTEAINFGLFQHQVAIVKLVLTLPDDVTEATATNVGLSATGLYKSAQIDLTTGTGTISNGTAGNVTTGTAGITSKKYITTYLCIFPGTLTNAKAIATVGTDLYQANLADLSIEAGKMYTATVTMKKSIIGYYYYSDGSCESTYTDIDKTCIGIVFWESEDGTKGKIADLTDSKLLMWANTEYTTKEWGFSNKADGAVATKAVISDQEGNEDFEYYYPLFHWLYTTKNNNDVNGRWYIPAIDELEQLLTVAIENETFKNALTTAGTALRISVDKPAWYWTSTEGRPGGTGKLSINVAEIEDSNTITNQFGPKEGSTCVRAISAITISN